MKIILKYFNNLSPTQIAQLEQLQSLYTSWNEKINVISRKDIGNLYERHVLHSLSIAKLINFVPQTRIIDVGTGGGFPGIPLAIIFPEVDFTLVDSIGKKITVVKEISKYLNLNNITALNIRSEDIKQKFDFVVSRAVSQIPLFINMTRHLLALHDRNSLPNGYLYLKGGNCQAELNNIKMYSQVYNIATLFSEDYFVEKHIVYISC